MGDVDALQDAEEAVAQMREEEERDEKAKRQAELREQPIKETALRERVPELIPLAQIEVLSNIRGRLEQIHELALSIKERGLMQALVVRRSPTGAAKPFQLVAGRRRYEALQMLHADAADALVRAEVLDDLTEAEVYELMFTENVQRVPLKPMEVARALRYLLDLNPEMKASALSRSLGLRPDWALRHFRLLELPEEVQAQVESGDLSFTIADLLRRGQKKGQVSEDQVKEIADQVISGEVSTKDVRDLLAPKPKDAAGSQETQADDASWVDVAPVEAEDEDAAERRRELERQADAILGTHPLPDASSPDLVYETWTSAGEAGPVATALAGGMSKRALDAYLLGLLLRDLVGQEYLESQGISREKVFEYTAGLEHAELLSGIRAVARHLAAHDPNLPASLTAAGPKGP